MSAMVFSRAHEHASCQAGGIHVTYCRRASGSRSFPSGRQLVKCVGQVMWSRFITFKINLKCLTQDSGGALYIFHGKAYG